MINQFESQIKNELLIEIGESENNYTKIKDILSGAKYDPSDVRGILQTFKDNLSKVGTLLVLLYKEKGTPVSTFTNPFLNTIDIALLLMETYPQEEPSVIIRATFALSYIKIENIMSLISIVKKYSVS